ncbi:MAG: hypothetical protein ACW963_02615 [Candidatus Sifarchaeia archaeon]|jgi:hypothetical protein
MSALKDTLLECIKPYQAQFSYSCKKTSGRAYSIKNDSILYILIDRSNNSISISKMGPVKYLPQKVEMFKITADNIEIIRSQVHGFIEQR